MPKTKTANGLGSVRYNKARRRYEGTITVSATKGADGRWTQRRRMVTGKTQAEVRARMEALRTATDVSPTLPAEVTVAAFLDYWLTDVLPSRVTPTTLVNYRHVVANYVTPHVGKVRLDALDPSHVRKMLMKIHEAGLSPNTARLARSVLRRALRSAESDGLVTRNVAALVDGVRVPRPEGRTLTPEQAKTLLVSIEGTEHEALVTILLALGLRKGEALGLTWADIDLDDATLTVNRALKKDGRGGVYTDEPKTSGSRRRIHLPGPVVAVLRRHRVAQAAERLAFGQGFGRGWGDLVFTSSVGTPLDPDRVNRMVQAITDRAGLGRWTPHEMRHSAASLLLAMGVPLEVVSEMLGHASIRITKDVYGHLLEPARREAATAMEALWN